MINNTEPIYFSNMDQQAEYFSSDLTALCKLTEVTKSEGFVEVDKFRVAFQFVQNLFEFGVNTELTQVSGSTQFGQT